MRIEADATSRSQMTESALKVGALQKAIFDSADFSSIAIDANGVIQIEGLIVRHKFEVVYSMETSAMSKFAPEEKAPSDREAATRTRKNVG